MKTRRRTKFQLFLPESGQLSRPFLPDWDLLQRGGTLHRIQQWAPLRGWKTLAIHTFRNLGHQSCYFSPRRRTPFIHSKPLVHKQILLCNPK